jgi:hypothetical protein
MSNQTVIELEQVVATLLPYATHKYSCESLEPMWHKGPCDCGFAAVVVQLRSIGINIIDGAIYEGSPQPPLVKVCVKCGKPIPEPILDGFEDERCRNCADPE